MSASRRLLSLAILPLILAALVAGPSASAATRATPVIELRETLGRALGEHTFLAMEAMRSVVQMNADATPLVDALEANTVALESTFGRVYGGAAGAEFGRLWRQHIDALVSYAMARQASDDTQAQTMLTVLATYRRDFSAFLARTDPNLAGEHEAVALQLHIQQLVAFADAAYDRAFQAERVAYGHMYELGDHFALAISDRFPGRFQGARVAFSPSGELRMDLGRLLGEHLILASQAMRAGIDRSPDAQAAADAMTENTAELAGVVERVYGPAAGESFARVWAPHIDQYLVYVEAIASNDTAARDNALAALRAYPAQIADFLAEANPKLSRAGARELLSHHVESLIEVVDRYAAGDAAGSVAAVRAAHNHMFMVSAAVTRAIVAQFPGRYQDLDVLPRTDGLDLGGMTDGSTVPWPAVLLGLGAIMWAGALLLRISSRSAVDGSKR
jgi:hypothetical protein